MIKGTDREQHTKWYTRLLGRIILSVMGWKVYGAKPPAPKAIILLTPHTSNWDVVIFLSAAAILDVRLRWMIKDTWFFWPMSWLFEAFGAIPIDRSRANNVVDQTVEALNESDYLYIGIPPEGTRKFRPYWKSGFYWTAMKAKVPVSLGYMCGATKTCGITKTIDLTGDVEADMKVIREYYAQWKGWTPENFSTPVLRSNEDPSKTENAAERVASGGESD